MVLDVRVGDVDGIGCKNRNGVDLKEGSHLGDLEVGVESVAQHGVARIGVGAGLDSGLGANKTYIREDREQQEQEEGFVENKFSVWHYCSRRKNVFFCFVIQKRAFGKVATTRNEMTKDGNFSSV